MPIFSINNKILVQCKATHIRLIAFLSAYERMQRKSEILVLADLIKFDVKLKLIE
jgi:hypothetical protein